MNLQTRVFNCYLLIGFFWLTAAAAHAQNIYLWSDAKGFVPASGNCVSSLQAQIPLRVGTTPSGQLQLITAARYSATAAQLSEFVLEVLPQAPTAYLTNTGIRLAGTLWESQMQGAQYATLTCANNAYYVFNVFTPDSATAVAQVGLNPSDKKLLSKVRILTGTQAAAQTTASLTSAPTTAAMPHPVAAAAPATSPLDVPTATGRLDHVACTQNGSIPVWNESLTQVVFQATNSEAIKIVQSFGVDKQTKINNGETVTYIRVQLPNQQMLGWVDARQVQVQSECAFIAPRVEIPDGLMAETKPTSNCCLFPVAQRPTANYKTLQRRFGAARTGREHAACDIYRLQGDNVLSIADGVVLRNQYPFYEGVDAIEVQHTGGFVVRYGEVMHTKVVSAIKAGVKVKKGEIIAYVGKVNSGCCTPMLHFELYSGATTGSLTNRTKQPYQRRSDLLDPSTYLTDWEQTKFGAHW